MHLIFESVGSLSKFLLVFFKLLKFKVFYLNILHRSETKKNEIASYLKNQNIFPLPIEKAKSISPQADFALLDQDREMYGFNLNKKIYSDDDLKKICHFFSLGDNEIKKLRLLFQDFIYQKFSNISFPALIWSHIHPDKKVLLISYKITALYSNLKSKNIFIICLPVDIIFYFLKVFKNILFFPFSFNKRKKFVDKDSFNKSAAFVLHKGITYGAKHHFLSTGHLKKYDANNLYDKTLYYSEDKNSPLNKHNILHFDYDNFPAPEEDEKINWINLNFLKYSKTKILFDCARVSLSSLYLVKSLNGFIGWVLFLQRYKSYRIYLEVLKQFKKLKLAIIDYDCMCPKTLILALSARNIETVTVQERFSNMFYKSFANVIVDNYYVQSDYAAETIKGSDFYDVKRIVPVGLYKANLMEKFKGKNIPQEIVQAKANKKKVVIVLGYHSPNNWFESYPDPVVNWSAQIFFLNEVIKLSENINDVQFILRYKTLNWLKDKHFEDILNKINKTKNLSLSKEYSESFYSHKLCANADLVIAKYTSLADDCLAKEIPTLFYNYLHNAKSIFISLKEENFLPEDLVCKNYEELFQKSKKALYEDAENFKKKVEREKKKFFSTTKQTDIKNKLISDCMQIINS